MRKPYFSVIIPVFNEEENILPLFNKLQKTLLPLKKKWEVIFVNDGSIDESDVILSRLKKEFPNIRIITFTRNFGQTAAFSAGIESSRGEILITMDGDLQNDPFDIPMMLLTMKNEKADVVCGWRKKRHDPILRTIVSKFANTIINTSMHSRIHDLGCSLRVYKKEAISKIQLYGEMHRFIPILAGNLGVKVIEVPVSHHPRKFGKSKYGMIRTLKVLLDLVTVKYLTGYQTKPIYMFGFVGMFLIFLSFLAGTFVIVRKVFYMGDWVSPMLFIMTILFNVGVVCILMGLLAEIQIRTWYESSGKKEYIIKK